MNRPGLALSILAVSVAGCTNGTAGRPQAPTPAIGAQWRAVATPADRARIRAWRSSWMTALDAIKGADGGVVAREGALFQPDRTLSEAIPPAGKYRCRAFKLGRRLGGSVPDGPRFVGYPSYECSVSQAGQIVRFAKTGGPQRPVGAIFRDSTTRGVFLGSLVLGDEQGALAYGRDASRDMAGIVERIGARRWRIVLPAPRFESLLDVIELVPAG